MFLTGPAAVAIVNDVVVAAMKDFRLQTDINRPRVDALGTGMAIEHPYVSQSHRLDCSFTEASFNTSGIPGALKRYALTAQSFEDQLVLDEKGIQVDLFRHISDLVDPDTNMIKAKRVPYATIIDAFLLTDGVSLSTSSIANRTQSFVFIKPVLISLGEEQGN